MLIRLVIGCAWDVERLMGNVVSDTTLRHRRDEWIRAGVFDRLADEAVVSYDGTVALAEHGAASAASRRGMGDLSSAV
jgi:hypothetical protein